MKLVVYQILVTELQAYLDKHGNKVRFIIPCIYTSNAKMVTVVLEE